MYSPAYVYVTIYVGIVQKVKLSVYCIDGEA